MGAEELTRGEVIWERFLTGARVYPDGRIGGIYSYVFYTLYGNLPYDFRLIFYSVVMAAVKWFAAAITLWRVILFARYILMKPNNPKKKLENQFSVQKIL